MDESIKKTCKKLNLSKLNYIKCICRFTKDTINSAKKDIKDNLDIGNDKKRVWALFGKDGKDGKYWYCLEVGSSNNIQTEILSNLQSMQQEPKAVWKGAYFHKDKKLFAFQTYMDRASCYSYVRNFVGVKLISIPIRGSIRYLKIWKATTSINI